MTIDIRADDELEAMIDIAAKASKAVLAHYQKHLETGIAVQHKGPGDPVTVADEEADDLICSALEERFRAAAVVAEESAPREPNELAERMRRDRVFYVDPLDGTHEFVDKNDQFAVMIGLAVGGCAPAGVVAIPTEGLLLAGRVGQRAFVQHGDGRREMLRVSARGTFGDATMLASRNHRPAIIDPLRRRLGIGNLVGCGSVGVKVARLAQGRADLYAHDGPGLKLWDCCGPEAIISAAGGRLTDLQGLAINYRASLELTGGLAVSNGILHPGLLSACGWARREADRLGRG